MTAERMSHEFALARKHEGTLCISLSGAVNFVVVKFNQTDHRTDSAVTLFLFDIKHSSVACPDPDTTDNIYSSTVESSTGTHARRTRANAGLDRI